MPFKVISIISMVSLGASIANSLLPPWETYSDFPRFQKYYKAFLLTLTIVAANLRTLVHPSLSTGNGQQPSKAALNLPNDPTTPENK
jgi:hypothetical protein